MSQLSVFTADERALIVSLPYRVGVHISYVEDEDGEEDDTLEMKALEVCIREVAKVHGASEIIQDVSKEILASRDQWDGWSQGVFNMAPDCEKAAAIVERVLSEGEAKAYKLMVMSVAQSVAQAYGEFGMGAEDAPGFFGKLMKKFTTAPVGSQDHPENVSAAEDSAIAVIAKALDI
ncbi:MAG: hypothetical protein KDI13_07655 [Alphaproteobacteria bacterium]|nr:hypothetical protein [Alphaproteobacteria bacterium]